MNSEVLSWPDILDLIKYRVEVYHDLISGNARSASGGVIGAPHKFQPKPHTGQQLLAAKKSGKTAPIVTSTQADDLTPTPV